MRDIDNNQKHNMESPPNLCGASSGSYVVAVIDFNSLSFFASKCFSLLMIHNLVENADKRFIVVMLILLVVDQPPIIKPLSTTCIRVCYPIE